MSQRISKSDLEQAVRVINTRMGLPLETYTKDAAGKYQPNANVYHLDGAYGGWKLAQMCETGTGTRDVLGGGYVSKRELYDKLQAFIAGLGQAPFSTKVADALDTLTDGRGFGNREQSVIMLCDAAPNVLAELEYWVELDEANELASDSDMKRIKALIKQAKGV